MVSGVPAVPDGGGAGAGAGGGGGAVCVCVEEFVVVVLDAVESYACPFCFEHATSARPNVQRMSNERIDYRLFPQIINLAIPPCKRMTNSAHP